MRAITRAAAVLALLVAGAGCGGGDDDSSDAEVALRDLALAYVVGAYEGTCVPLPDGDATPGVVELVATGDLDAPGVVTTRGALLDRSMSYTIRRDLDAAGPRSIGLSIDNGTDAGLAVEMTTQQGALVRVRQGTRGERTGTECTGVAALGPLRDRPLLPLVADLLTAASRPFRCTGPAGTDVRDHAVGAAGATLGAETYPFTTGLARERLYVGPVAEGDRLVYEVRLLDGRSFAVQVDERGVADYLLTRPDQDGEYTECVPA